MTKNKNTHLEPSKAIEMGEGYDLHCNDSTELLVLQVAQAAYRLGRIIERSSEPFVLSFECVNVGNFYTLIEYQKPWPQSETPVVFREHAYIPYYDPGRELKLRHVLNLFNETMARLEAAHDETSAD